MFVLDTNVVSELRYGKPNQSTGVRAAFASRILPFTDNTADFAGTGVALVNPWGA